MFKVVIFSTLLSIIASFTDVTPTIALEASCELREKDWRNPELEVWRDICQNGHAELSGSAVSSGLIRTLLTKPPYRSVLIEKGLYLNKLMLNGDLDLSHLEFNSEIAITESKIDGAIILADSTFTKSLSFVGSDIDKGIDANRAIITGSLLLGKLDRTEPNHELITDNSAVRIGSIVARSIHMGGSFNIFSAFIDGDIEMEGSRIGGDFNIMNVVGHYVLLFDSEVEGQADIVDSHFSPDGTKTESKYDHLVNYFDSKFDKSIFFNRSEFKGSIGLEAVEVAHNANFLGAYVESVDMHDATIHDQFNIGRQWYDFGDFDTRWGGDSILDLSHANIGSIAGPTQRQFWPRIIRFSGLTLGNFIPRDCAEDKPCEETVDWFRNWLDLGDSESKASFHSHQVVMNILNTHGDKTAADEMGYYGRDQDLRNTMKKGEIFESAYLLGAKYATGFGYYPAYSIIHIIILTAIGAVVFITTEEAKKFGMPFGIAYSFDMLLPIIKLRELHYTIDIRGPARYYFYCHKLVGFVLGFFLVASVAGWTK
jgi:hypothetical protein